jgi:hypothetical protein
VNAINLPAYLQNSNLPDFTDRLGANLGTRAQPYVSIEGDRLTLVDTNGDTEPVLTVDKQTGDPYLDCVIIDTCDHESKIYYGREYDPKAVSFSPPKCWSDNGVAPSVNCSEPQAKSCQPDPEGGPMGNGHGCYWAMWGSGRAREGSKTVPPACGKYQKLALLIPGDDIQFLLRVPPNSLAPLAEYNSKFKGHSFTMRDVMTRISINNKTLAFKGLDFLTEELAKQRNEVLLAKKTDALVGRGDKPRVLAVAGQPAGGQSPLALGAPPAHIASSPASVPVETTSPLSATNVAAAGTVIPPSAPSAANAEVPASTGAPTRRRGRPPKVDPAAVTGNPVAPFRQPAEGGQAPNGQFGMAPAVAPNPQLEAAIKSVFG